MNKLLILLLLGFGLSGRFATGRLGIFMSLEVRYAFLGSIIMVLLLCRKPRLRKRTRQTFSFLVWSVALCGTLLMSALWSGTTHSIPKMLDVALVMMFLFVTDLAVRMFPDPLDALLTVSTAITTVALAYMLPIIYTAVVGGSRGSILLGGPNVATRVLFFGAMCSLVLFQHRRRGVYVAMTILNFAGIVLLGSRGGIVAAALSVGALCLTGRPGARSKGVIRYLLAASLGVGLLLPLRNSLATMYRDRVQNLLLGGIYWAGRDIIYRSAISLMASRPLWGFGLNGWRSAIGTYPHNLFFEVMLDAGLLALLPLLGVLSFAPRVFMANRSGMLRYLGILPCYMVVVAMVSGDFYDFRFFFFWTVLVLGLSGRSEKEPDTSTSC